MNTDLIVERFFEALIDGDRPRARNMIVECVKQHGFTPSDLVTELFWPTYQNLDKLQRADQITAVAHHTAVRLLRVLVDQNSARMEFVPTRGRSVFVVCGQTESDDMGAQMAVDLLELEGFSVCFVGGGVANDEIIAQVNERKPDVLLAFASSPADLPNLRTMIDTLREIGACATTQVAVGAGVFNRAEGLAEEIGADLWATDPLEMVEKLVAEPERRATSGQRTVGKNKKPTAPVQQRKAA
jgi:methanogenic corrinoid protein MtbC1